MKKRAMAFLLSFMMLFSSIISTKALAADSSESEDKKPTVNIELEKADYKAGEAVDVKIKVYNTDWTSMAFALYSNEDKVELAGNNINKNISTNFYKETEDEDTGDVTKSGIFRKLSTFYRLLRTTDTNNELWEGYNFITYSFLVDPDSEDPTVKRFPGGAGVGYYYLDEQEDGYDVCTFHFVAKKDITLTEDDFAFKKHTTITSVAEGVYDDVVLIHGYDTLNPDWNVVIGQEKETNPSLDTTIKDGLVTKADKMTFDLFAKDLDGNKISTDNIDVTLNGEKVGVNWDDVIKTSYTLNLAVGLNNVLISVKDSAGRVTEKSYTLTREEAQDGDVIGQMAFSLEGFTIGEGYIVEPTLVDIIKGENGAELLTRTLEENGFDYKYTGRIKSGFYLSAIKGDIYKVNPTIPEVLRAKLEEHKCKTDMTRYKTNSLGEFDFSHMAGWMYSVNNVFPNVGFSDCYPQNGDVMRVQFTMGGYGADLGGCGAMGGYGKDYYPTANKGKLLSFIAKVNSSGAMKDGYYLADSGFKALYDEANTAIQTLDATQSVIDDIYTRITNYAFPAQDTVLNSLSISGLSDAELVKNYEFNQYASSAFKAVVDPQVKGVTFVADPENKGVTVVARWMENGEEKTKEFKADENGKITMNFENAIESDLNTFKFTVKAPEGSDAKDITYAVDVYKNIPLTGIALDKSELAIEKGETADLNLKYNEENTSDDKTIKWSTSDKNVATVKNGKITTLKSGDVVITAKVGNYEVSCNVKVLSAIESISINPSTATLGEGDTKQLSVNCSPYGYTDTYTKEFTSSDESIATVDENGLVTAIKSGKATITCKFKTSRGLTFEKTSDITVIVPINDIELSDSDITLVKGDTYVLNATAAPAENGDLLKWESSSWGLDLESTVGNTTTIKANRTGTATVTVYSNCHSNVKKTCKVTVVDSAIPVTSVTLANNELSMTTGDKAALAATVLPENTTDHTSAVWNSDNEAAVTVDQKGNIEAVGNGTANITVTKGGVVATCVVTVKMSAAEELAASKAAATSEIESYVNLNDYRAAEQAKIQKFVAAGKSAIDKASTVDEVTLATRVAKKFIDTLKTDAQYTAEEKAAADKAAADKVSAQINALGEVTLENEDAVVAARKAYVELTADQKAYVSEDTVKVLTDAEKTIVDLKAAKELAAAKETAKTELESYVNLNDYRAKEQATIQKFVLAGKMTIDKASTLDEVTLASRTTKMYIDTLKTDAQYAAEEKAAADKAAAEVVSTQINALGDVTLESEDAVVAARKAYDELTVDQKAYVSEDTVKVLTDAEKSIVDLKAAKELTAAKETAKSELNSYVNLSDYRTVEQATIQKAVMAGKAAIDKASTLDEVALATRVTKKYIDTLKTDAQYTAEEKAAALAAAKTSAITEIENYVNLEDYRTAEQDTIKTVLAAAKDSINTAESIEGVNNLIVTYKEAVDKVKTDAQLTAEEKLASDKEAANKVIEKINAIGTVTLESKTAINEAKAAYNALTDDQKAYVSEDVVKVLTDAQTELERLEVIAADKAAAQAVADKITAIGTVTLDSKTAIEAARKAYAELTDAQKVYVSEDVMKVLADSETELERLEVEAADKAAAQAVTDKIAAIGTVTLDSKDAIKEARAAYEGLTATQKAFVSEGTVLVLTNAETELARLEKEAADKAAAKVVADQINAIGTVTLENKETVAAVREAYEALTAEQKAFVGEETLTVLTDAEKEIVRLEKEAADKAAAQVVTDQINAIGTVTIESENVIKAAREAFEGLTQDQKAFVSEETLEVLTNAETALNTIKGDIAAANEVVAKINAIGTVTLESKDAIASARTAYDLLTDSQKAFAGEDVLKVLTAAEDAYKALVDEANEAAAKAVEDAVNAIGTVTLESEDAIKAAREAYDALTDAQKALVKENVKEILTNAETKLAELKKQAEIDAANKAEAKKVEDLINAIGEVTLEKETVIAAARTAYDALTAEQLVYLDKEAVSVLTNAETKLAELKEQAAIEAANKAKAQVVIDKINAIGVVTLDSEAAIADARAAYDELGELQSYVSESVVNTLVSAEKTLKTLKEEAEAAAKLAAAKEAGLAKLAEYGNVDLSLYREAQQTEIASILSAYTESINAASSQEEIDTLLVSANKSIKAVKTDAQLKEQESFNNSLINFINEAIVGLVNVAQSFIDTLIDIFNSIFFA